MKFKYKNDIITVDIKLWLFGALLRQFTDPYFHSQNYEYDFYSFSSYWQEVGKRNSLVQFITSRIPGKYGPKSYATNDIVQRLARLDLGENPGVIISNIDPSKVDRLMLMFAGVSRDVFIRGEFVVFPTKNREVTQKLTYSIPVSIADVTGFIEGYVYCTNESIEE